MWDKNTQSFTTALDLFPNQLIAIVEALKHTVIPRLDALQLRAICRSPHIHEIGRNNTPDTTAAKYVIGNHTYVRQNEGVHVQETRVQRSGQHSDRA